MMLGRIASSQVTLPEVLLSIVLLLACIRGPCGSQRGSTRQASCCTGNVRASTRSFVSCDRRRDAAAPALIAGLVVGLIVEVVTRTLTGGRYIGDPMPV
jgi:hypothetical protein